MTLFDVTKNLLGCSELIGEIEEIHMRKKGEYLPEGVYIQGRDPDGRVFSIEFVHEEEKQDAEKLE